MCRRLGGCLGGCHLGLLSRGPGRGHSPAIVVVAIAPTYLLVTRM
jgi:hypothetical protein